MLKIKCIVDKELSLSVIQLGKENISVNIHTDKRILHTVHTTKTKLLSIIELVQYTPYIEVNMVCDEHNRNKMGIGTQDNKRFRFKRVDSIFEEFVILDIKGIEAIKAYLLKS